LKITLNIAFLGFQFWHFLTIFLTSLVPLFERKLQVSKTRPKLTIFAILINTVLNETFFVIF